MGAGNRSRDEKMYISIFTYRWAAGCSEASIIAAFLWYEEEAAVHYGTNSAEVGGTHRKQVGEEGGT
jgi:hypothetical protein